MQTESINAYALRFCRRLAKCQLRTSRPTATVGRATAPTRPSRLSRCECEA